ncbi:MAG: methionine--tRNA ligase [Actinomycetota bacterium]|nr:methionine--tRNA ligase [Actinomycetota bacterium]
MTTTYLTVAIPYVNAQPHLGYAYELVLADIVARACRLDGVDVRLLGGTDDQSLKNVLAAEAAGVPVRDFVDGHARRFEELGGCLDVSFDDFIRTSADARHVPAVHRLWHAALENGDLYRRAYEGDYCVGCEEFLADSELVDGRCPEHDRPVEHLAEENWFFRLSRYQDRLGDLISSGALRITPTAYRNEVLAFVRSGLEDISVSRSVERARGWGVPVPNDPTQVIYVWFDALTNYLSALRFGEPDSADHRRWWSGAQERTHVVGKGILRFHAVYWPAFLLSAGERPPSHIRVHPYLTIGGRKISKSGGARLDPVDVASACGTDVVRWWFCRDVAESADTDVTIERLVDRANTDLVGGVGNVVGRVVGLVHRLRDGAPPRPDAGPLDAVADLPVRTRRLLRAFELRHAAREIVDAVGVLNRDLEATAPWRLAHEPAAADRLDAVLSRQLATARIIAEALTPITPTLADRARRQLTAGPALPPPEPLVPRLVAVRTPALG